MKERAITLLKELHRVGALSQDAYNTLLAGLYDMPVASAETPLGTIVVKKVFDEEHPGFYIDLRKSGCDAEPDDMPDAPLALVEFCKDEGDRQDGEQCIITRVWGDVRKEDYTSRVVHKGVKEYFAG